MKVYNFKWHWTEIYIESTYCKGEWCLISVNNCQVILLEHRNCNFNSWGLYSEFVTLRDLHFNGIILSWK